MSYIASPGPYAAPALSKKVGSSILRLLVPPRVICAPSPACPQTQKKPMRENPATDAGESRNGAVVRSAQCATPAAMEWATRPLHISL